MPLREKQYKTKPWILFVVFLLIYPALYNGYPLVTSDTGTYISSGFKTWIPADRPIFYGLFVRHSSLASSLWFTIILQGLMLSFVLWQTLNLFVSDAFGKIGKLVLIIILCSFSSISWYTSQIMPDILVGTGLLAFLLLVLNKKSVIITIFNSLILLIACMSHNSNMLIFSILALFILIYGFYSNAFKRQIINVRDYILIPIIIILSWLFTLLINYSITKNIEISGSPHAFLVAKNIENGIIDRYLNENCKKYIEKNVNDTTTYFIAAKHSKKFFDVIGFSKKPGAYVHQWAFTMAQNQKFKIIKDKDEWARIISLQSNLYLETTVGDSGATINKLVQMPFSNSDKQLFKFVPTTKDSDSFYIINKSTLKFVDVSGTSQENAAVIQLWDSAGTDNQKFILLKGNHCLCLFKDELPNSAIAFLWDDKSVFSQTGSWAWSKKEYDKILNEIILSPKYFGANLGEAIIATFSQLTRNDIGDGLIGYDNKSAPYGAIKSHLRYELKPFNNSKQNKWLLNFTEINKRHFWLLLFSVLTILIFVFNAKLKKEIPSQFSFFIGVSLFVIVLNAFVTGAMANVLDRLQSRIVWLIPLIALILLYNRIVLYFKKDQE